MKNLFILLLCSALLSCLGTQEMSVRFTLDATKADTHYIEVEMSCEHVPTGSFLLKLPVWAPGYYNIMNYPMNIIDFEASTSDGEALPWHKEKKNGWRIENGKVSGLIVKYRVWANGHSVAQSNLSEDALFLAPNGVLMYPEGEKNLPIEVGIVRNRRWKNLVTGLKSIDNKGDTLWYKAGDFDELYDCPMYYGNQHVESFEYEGHHYDLSFADVGSLDIEDCIAKLKKVIKASAELIGDIPYDDYAFIFMGAGGGGLEHRNSQASFLGRNPSDLEGRLLPFMCHEYFHLYNVKSIRPIELGPFDYDRECYTNLLWLSEGATVFYEYRLLKDAGLMTEEDCLKAWSKSIKAFEQYEGKSHMTLARSSYDTWVYPPFVNPGNVDAVSFSYYDKGAAVTLLFDCTIRIISEGQRSFDDLMRLLYWRYFKGEGRGFTEEELNNAIREVAAPSTEADKALLDEAFSYIYTLKPLDYNRFLQPLGMSYDPQSMSISSL